MKDSSEQPYFMTNEKWYYYDFVSGDYEIREGKPDYTGRIVVIGSKMDEHRIEELFFGGK